MTNRELSYPTRRERVNVIAISRMTIKDNSPFADGEVSGATYRSPSFHRCLRIMRFYAVVEVFIAVPYCSSCLHGAVLWVRLGLVV